MRVSAWQDNLTNALKLVGKSVSKKSTLPVLESVKLSTKTNLLYLETSDLNTAIRIGIGVSIETDGEICVPYAGFAKFVDRLSPERVELDTVQRTLSLNLSCGASKAEFKGIAADEFPVIQWPKDNETIDVPVLIIPANVLMRLISDVQYAAQRKDDRPVLNGISLQYNWDTLKALASDGYRMAYREHTFSEPSFDGDFEIIIPLSAVEKFKSLFADAIKHGDDLHLVVDDEKLFILSDHIEYLIHLTEGQFPNYQSINFSNNDYTVNVDPTTLVNLLNRAEVFSENAKISTERLKDTMGVLRVNAKSTELGTTEGIADAYFPTYGENVSAVYDIAQLTEVMKKFENQSIRLDFKRTSIGYSSALSTFVLKITPDKQSWHLLMPERVTE